MAINWQNLFTLARSASASVVAVAGGIAAAPAGTFDPKVTSTAMAVTAISAGLTGLAHLRVEATNPATFPQTPIVTPAAQVLEKAVVGTGAATEAPK